MLLWLCGRLFRVEEHQQQPFQPWPCNNHKFCNLDSYVGTYGSQTDHLQFEQFVNIFFSRELCLRHNWHLIKKYWQNHALQFTVLNTRQLVCFVLHLLHLFLLWLIILLDVLCSNSFPPLYKVLTSHSCSEEGLEDAANILLQLSRGDGSTRDTVLRLLLSGARHLGYTLCKQIGQCWAATEMPILMLQFKLK